MTSVHRQEGTGGAELHRLLTSRCFGRLSAKSAEPLEQRETAAAEARVDRETATTEQRRLMAEVFELKLQLAEEIRSRPGVSRGEPWTTGSRGEPRGPIETTAAGGDRITNPGGTVTGLDDRMHIEPMRWMESESAPSPARSRASTSSRNGDSGAVPVQRENGETQVEQIKDVPLFVGTKAKFPAWKQNFLCLAKLHDVFGIFTDGVDVPVADETMPIAALQEAFPHENVQKYLIAWNILSRAIANNGDRDILRYAFSPAAGRRALVDRLQCIYSWCQSTVSPVADVKARQIRRQPHPRFAAMIEDVRNMRANGSDIEDEVVCLLFLRALPDEYNVFRQMLEREREKLTIDRLRTELRARYDLLKEGKSLKTSDTAFLASGTKRGNSGRRREKCGNVSGTKKKDGGATRRDSNGQGSSSGAGDSNGAPSGKQGGPTRCNICKETGHKRFKCPKRICSSAARLYTIPIPRTNLKAIYFLALAFTYAATCKSAFPRRRLGFNGYGVRKREVRSRYQALVMTNNHMRFPIKARYFGSSSLPPDSPSFLDPRSTPGLPGIFKVAKMLYCPTMFFVNAV